MKTEALIPFNLVDAVYLDNARAKLISGVSSKATQLIAKWIKRKLLQQNPVHSFGIII